MLPSGPPARGSLARLARDTLCPACGRALRDPVLLACEHSCCRRCLRRGGPGDGPADGPGEGSAGVAVTCPRCRLPCAPKRLRTPVALAVESRIAQRLARGEPAGPPRRRGCSLGAQLRADAATPPRPPSPKEPPKISSSPPPPPC